MDDGGTEIMIRGQLFSRHTLQGLCALFCLVVLFGATPAAAAHRGSHSYHRSPYSSSAYTQYHRTHYNGYGYNGYRYNATSWRPYPPVARSTFYGYGGRRYTYRYRPYSSFAYGYRYYRPWYYGYNYYPRTSISYYGFSNGYNSNYYYRPFCGAWGAYSSCYCSPFSGVTSSYYPGYGSYSVWGGMGSYAPLWGSYTPYWGSYYATPWSYYPGYFGGYYGPYCGIWPYRPTLYQSIVYQSGFNVGYGRGSYYGFW
ncbi:hypothetical protein Enr10x_55550 [Gimesia panareensis]|uniref:Uncharacterized protein n=2 Tax=Gimesia panareensis TaxID=2527978 RepID=A0A517QF38_9PLAN|nr:hypothetical protein Enr10x_55550 [Gimesia panareensis]